MEPEFNSFVGSHPLPVRHGMSIGEVDIMANRFWEINCRLEIIPMKGWNRAMYFDQTGLPWVLPSPNLATLDAALTFPGTVLFEGTNLSEGRGTTRSLETIGHPAIEPYGLLGTLNQLFSGYQLEGFTLRPVNFIPTFQKHQDKVCGGYQIHVTNAAKFQPWKVGQLLCYTLYHELGENFNWKQPPYEYEYDKMPIDILNGSDKLRLWVENKGAYEELLQIETVGRTEFEEKRKTVLLYD